MWYLVVILAIFLAKNCDSFHPQVLQINYGVSKTYVINSSTEYILEFSPNTTLINLPPRVTIKSHDATMSAPLMVVARQPRQLLSWQLPLILETDHGKTIVHNTSRTLCREIYNGLQTKRGIRDDDRYYNPIVTISTVSNTDINFTVEVDYQDDFYIQPSVQYNFTISPSEPRYYFYNFTTNSSETKRDSNYDTVLLEVFSDSDVCMTVSIQNVTCPVFDTNVDITFRGFYETVSTKGGITIPKYKFPHGFFAVFVAKADDSDCTNKEGIVETDRNKFITLTIKPSITYDDYYNAVIITLGAIGAFYFVFGLAFFFCSRSYMPRRMEYVDNTPDEQPTASMDNPVPAGTELVDSISVDDYDHLIEADSDYRIRLGKSKVFLCDLARKDPRILRYKSNLYLYNVLTVALFYGLPVVQLVITYQRVLNETGQQDLCYYNFLCAHPLGVISDFNHLFSNIGYVLFGILFLWISYRRGVQHKDLDFDRQYGIPQHYGMFYAMGVSLIMEGVLSGSYHICPNQSNFQFDSSFMYVMAVLCMVKLYQNRHPDINATACATFGVLAVAILLGMIGILEGNLYFWIFFTILYILMCFYLSAQIYYMGCWKLDRSVLWRVYRIGVHDFWAGPINVIRPTHKARMCLLIVGNLCNWALAAWGVYRHQKDFAQYLLAIFMANTLLYFFFYIIMKYLHKERVNKLSWLFLSISVICAISALYFFVHRSISWSKTPAESRQYNQECKLLRFYDFHDIWHFLSAVGMFFTFMVLLTLDDDLSHTHRSQIVVF